MRKADCLALVECSPAAVAMHDKQGWLDIFARDCVVEDPVGSAPHVSREQDHGPGSPLSHFCDAFIAANDIFMRARSSIGEPGKQKVAFFTFDRRSGYIKSLRLYW